MILDDFVGDIFREEVEEVDLVGDEERSKEAIMPLTRPLLSRRPRCPSLRELEDEVEE